MERSESYPSDEGQHSHGSGNSTSPLPPWEQRNVARVPYMNQNAQPLTPAEREALQSLWAANEQDETVSARPRGYDHVQRSFDSGCPQPGRDNNHDWIVPTPKTAPPFTSGRQPPSLPAPMSRQSHMIPPAPKSAPQLPSYVSVPSKSAPQASSYAAMPPTPPPENSRLSRSSTKSSTTTKTYSISSPRPSPRLPQHTIPSLPGAMSAREDIPSSKRSTRPKREERAKKEKPESAPFGKRFKLAMKDIFKREPIDESQFEHISDRHWTDE